MAYTLYIGNKNYSTWSLRGWLVTRASGAPFSEKLVSLNANEHAGVYQEFSPSGLVPCLVDGQTTVWDSLAITEYLHERHPGLWPAEATARAWARSICAEMHSGFRTLRGEMGMCIRERVDVRPWSPALARDIERITAIWNETLKRHGADGGKGGLLFGSFCAADAFFGPVAFRFRTYGVEPDGAAGKYLSALLAHPYMQEWERAALAETEIVEADEPRIIYGDRIGRAKA
ncbi:MAG: glutathione S-transferase family protein [Betaproteobacteria bacterium]